MPRVSVIIPAYNAAPTIGRTIESVLKQTFDDFEIVVVDDGSTDDTLVLVGAIADPRIRLHSFANGRLPLARNRGIAASRGEYIAFLDADDLWAPSKLASHVDILDRQPEVGVVYSWSCTIDDFERVLGRQRCVWFAGNVYEQMLEGFFVGNASNAIVRRAVVDSVGGFDESLDCGEDWEFLSRAAHRWPFAVVPDDLVFYRWRSGSMSSDAARMHSGLLVVVDKMFGLAPPELQPIRIRTLANVHGYVARTYLTRHTEGTAPRKAARSLWAVLRLRPVEAFNPGFLRLCARCLLVAVWSPASADALARRYHLWRSSPMPEAKPPP
jgi:glycosyltransferase involved in cell wall biosynthesis